MDLMTPALLLVLAQAATPAPPAAPAPAPAFVGPEVLLETSMGNIKLGLYPDKTPITVQNFLSYVRKGHYNGTIFHRVIEDFMIQGGGVDAATRQERPTDPPIKNEANLAPHNTRGTIAMARTQQPNSATAQFFINVKDNFGLDYAVRDMGYTVFGEVLEGMDVVDKIKVVPTAGANVPLTQVVIKTARILKDLPARAAAPAAKPAPPAARPAPAAAKPVSPPPKP